LIFKKKMEQEKNIRYKARCVSSGFMQTPGVDYTEPFESVASDVGIRVFIGICLNYEFQKNQSGKLVLVTLDVEDAF
jgi:Reverse transcriptase (RNA-dependent DNA polymerase)